MTTPAGIIGFHIEACRDLLAASTTWQTETGTNDAAAARAFTKAYFAGPPSTKPIAYISRGKIMRQSFDDQDCFATRAEIVLNICYPRTAPHTDANRAEALTLTDNSISAILADMEGLRGTAKTGGGTYWDFDSCVIDVPGITEPKSTPELTDIVVTFTTSWTFQ